VGQDTELGGYQIVGRLAVGGMAEIFQARSKPGAKRPGEPEEVVLKRLLPSLRSDGAFVKQFVDEAKLSIKLRHRHIVRTFRCFKAGIDYLTVQELVSGRPLSYMQELLAKGGTPMPPSAAVYIVHCMLKALDYLHRAKVGEGGGAVVHRDVSPANILLSVKGEVKLTDFGVAEVEGLMKGEQGALRGTSAYMSPEQVLGLPVDQRTDLYAAAVVLWELLANRRLFEGEGEAELLLKVRDAWVPDLAGQVEGLPAYGAQLVRRAVLADRALRFQTAQEFATALELLARRQGWPLSAEALQPLLGE
jgi:eukaryotic-like serine/threonine-protein kinase